MRLRQKPRAKTRDLTWHYVISWYDILACNSVISDSLQPDMSEHEYRPKCDASNQIELGRGFGNRGSRGNKFPSTFSGFQRIRGSIVRTVLKERSFIWTLH